MKIAKRAATYFFLLLILFFACLFIWQPYLIRVLWYRTPDAKTYQAFPQDTVHKSDVAFHFIRPKEKRNDLDSFPVLDGNRQSIPFQDYFKQGRLNAFLVIRNDSIIYEKYSDGYTDTTLTTVFSGAKSMVSILLGQALEDGTIKSLSQNVTDYIPELKANPAFKHIALKHLLEMKSGLEFHDALGGMVKAFLSDEARYYYTHDMRAELLKVKLANTPGTVWKYKSIDPILLGWVIERATGKSLSNYFEEKIWKKIGTEHFATWGLDQKGGLANTASRFQVTAIDWAKVGRLYLNGGRFDDDQVVPEDWVKQSVSIGSEVPASAKGWQKSAHHYLWWIPQAGEKGDFAAEGMRGQRLYADPKTNTIIVQFSEHGAGDYPYRKISRYLAGLPFSDLDW
ncbi:serine hydrolase domain-containing protein [Pedobacter petrophilus]|nr:serine hydrolase [Pedobacter petrophilus]